MESNTQQDADEIAKAKRNTGADVNYYLVWIADPKRKGRIEPYLAECEDIIEALEMNFAEGCAFKAIWRRCAAKKIGKMKIGYDGPTYDAEKAIYYGQRMVAQDARLAALGQAVVGLVANCDMTAPERSAE